MELIVFPDVEDLLRQHLDTVLPGAGFDARAYVKRPSTFPPLFVYVHRTGGPRRDMVTDNAQITAECYATRAGAPWESKAYNLASTVRAVIHALEREGSLSGVPVYEVAEFSGPYNDPDPLAPTYARFSATNVIAVRGNSTQL